MNTHAWYVSELYFHMKSNNLLIVYYESVQEYSAKSIVPFIMSIINHGMLRYSYSF